MRQLRTQTPGFRAACNYPDLRRQSGENTVDYSLGKDVTLVARWLTVVVILLSPALVFAQGKPNSSEQTAKRLDSVFAQFEGPAIEVSPVDSPPVEVPPANVEGLLEIPADGPLVGDLIQMPGAQSDRASTLMSSPIEAVSEVASPVYGASISDSISVVPDSATGPAPVFSTGSWFWNGSWYMSADYVVLKKDAPNMRLVAFDANTAIRQTAGGFIVDDQISTENETFEFESGARVTFGKFLGRDAVRRDHMVDFGFFGGFDWLAKAALNGEGSIFSGLTVSDLRNFSPTQAPTVTGFFNNDRQTYRYSSDLDSYEVNYRIQTRPGRDQMAIHPSGVWTRHASSGQIRGFSAGLRGMSINEGFLVEAFTDTDRTGMYRIRTGNDLFGPQVGFELMDPHDSWHWGFRSTLGTLVNFADRRSQIETLTEVIEGGVPREVIEERAQLSQEEHLSFLGQIGLYSAVQLRPNLSVRVAYDFIYVTGLGIAPNNARLGDEFPGFHTTGDALYHGASFGFVSQF